MTIWIPREVVFKAGYKADAEDAITDFDILDARAFGSFPPLALLNRDLNFDAIPSSRQG